MRPVRSHDQEHLVASDLRHRDWQGAARLYVESNTEAPRVSGWIDHASWLSDDMLLLVGWFHAEPDTVRLRMGTGDDTIAVDLDVKDTRVKHVSPIQRRLVRGLERYGYKRMTGLSRLGH